MAVQDIIGALGLVCPTELAACDTVCQTQIQQAMGGEETDSDSMSAETQAAVACFQSSVVNSDATELAEQGDLGGRNRGSVLRGAHVGAISAKKRARRRETA